MIHQILACSYIFPSNTLNESSTEGIEIALKELVFIEVQTTSECFFMRAFKKLILDELHKIKNFSEYPLLIFKK